MTDTFVADIPGAFERGRQFRQSEQLRPLELKKAQFGLDQQEQTLKFGQLQHQELQQKFDQRTDDQKNEDFVFSAIRIRNLPDNEKLAALKQNEQDIIAKGGDPTDTQKGIKAAEANDFPTLNQGLDAVIQSGFQQGIGKGVAKEVKPQGFTLGEGQTRFDATGKLIARGSEKAPKQDKEIKPIPQVLLSGLSEDVALKGAAAFSAAGGGKDGMTAFQKIVDQGSEQERRLASPAIIKDSFPRASEAERTQLQAAMDSAKTTESGLKAAGKIRSDQRRNKKAQAFQIRAVELLTKILASDELDDVLGSIEGSIDFRIQDAEAEIISDIEEATNILTADNMDLMSGVLSESDIRILKTISGGGLNRKRSEERFRTDVQTMIDKLNSQQVLTVDDQQKVVDQNREVVEGEIIINPTTGERLQVVNGQFVPVK